MSRIRDDEHAQGRAKRDPESGHHTHRHPETSLRPFVVSDEIRVPILDPPEGLVQHRERLHPGTFSVSTSWHQSLMNSSMNCASARRAFYGREAGETACA